MAMEFFFACFSAFWDLLVYFFSMGERWRDHLPELLLPQEPEKHYEFASFFCELISSIFTFIFSSFLKNFLSLISVLCMIFADQRDL